MEQSTSIIEHLALLRSSDNFFKWAGDLRHPWLSSTRNKKRFSLLTMSTYMLKKEWSLMTYMHLLLI